MENKDKKGARKSSRPPMAVFVICALVLAGVGVWIFEVLSSRSTPPASAARTLPLSVTWTPLVSQQHGFSVSLPAPAQNLSAAASGVEDTGPESTWGATYSGGTVMVKVIRCPEKLCRLVPDTLLDGVRKGTIEELGATLVSEQRLEIPCPQGKCRGLEFEATSNQGMHVSARVFVTRDKIFQVMGTQASGSSEIFRAVVDSFTFL